MNIVRENLEDLTTLLKVTVGEADYNEAVDKSLRTYRRKANIPGFRPGKPTSDYLNKILNYIVFIGAVGLTVVAIVPILASGLLDVSRISFSGTSLIIIVGVVLETIKAVESQMLVRYYKGFLND
mgnify:CR=1 FL=1